MIGRQEEQTQLNEIISSTSPSFVALYGRRRVGKTYLVKEYFNNKFTFYATGLANKSMDIQLSNFHTFLQEHFKTTAQVPANWMNAFLQLKKCLIKVKSKRIVFLDELPWFDTPKSDFMTGLDWFWNSWASSQKNFKLIVCGSAASWMINKLLNNTGGLHNRVTHRMKINPFTLAETEQYLKQKNILMSRYQIVKLYMAIGGVPFYLEQIRKGESDVQAIERLCFSPNGILRTEFNFIFSSLFKDARKHELIIKKIYELGRQATRENIVKATKIESSGDFSKKLMELEESGFISSYIPFGMNKSKKIYILSDYFSLFHFKFIDSSNQYDKGMWVNRIYDASIIAWQGLTFELICFGHIQVIKKALGIEGIYSTSSPWYFKGTSKKNGAQIDLIIDRKDGVINLCEIKFSDKEFIITKKYDVEMRQKLSVFLTETNTRKAIFPTMITSFGLQKNAYTNSFIQSEIVMNQLFE
jgi:uncharacterized protein